MAPLPVTAYPRIVTESSGKKPKIALHPKHPERICWGCDQYCSADDLRCGNGTIRTQHPSELFGEDWLEWKQDERTFAAGRSGAG
ncbi:MAG TPA: DUF3079 domain-containing protein [Terriglobales bacterium]|nr:DUF3079 domain-containing protein [Terriglobales bacterium]